MMPAKARALSLISLLLAANHAPATVAGTVAGTVAELDADFERDSIVIESSGHGCFYFDVYLAETEAQQRRGLMNVRKLPAFTGMLFDYDFTSPRSMWMKNTYIPLDILFIHADGKISSIARRTEPLSLQSIASTEAVDYTLELNGGVTEALLIDAESRVLLPDALSVTP
jgi:hypothetical protein